MDRSRQSAFICATALVTVLAAAGGWSPARAEAQTFAFDIPAKPLSQALNDYARTTGAQLVFADDKVAGRVANPVIGRAAPDAALAQLLRGSGLTWVATPNGAIMILSTDDPRPQLDAVVAAVQDETLAEVVVTGTRIAGASPVGSQAVVLDRAAMDRAGRSSAADLIQTLPQNVSLGKSQETRGSVQASPDNLGFATAPNLGGLGVDATLSLVNGHRLAQANYGGFVDISQIPLLAIERVEVIVDGASAIYGSDAVGGVVNFILRRNFDGVEAKAQAGFGDGFERYSLSTAAGATWAGGQGFLAVEYFEQARLPADERSYYTADLRRFGGPNLQNPNASPGNISAGGTTYAIPRGQNGVGLGPGQLVANAPNLTERWAGADILPRTRKFSAAGLISQELTPGLTLTLDGLATRRKSIRRTEAAVSTLTVPRINPFFVSPDPTAQSTSVLYSFLGDFGPQATGGISEDVTLHGAVEVKLPAQWSAELDGLISRNSVSFRNDDLPNAALLNQALADPNPSAAFNPFGDAGSNSAAVLNRVRGRSDFFTRGSLEAVGLQATGPVAALPAGDLRLALGAEVRREELRSYNEQFTSGLAPVLIKARLSRTIEAAFAEAYVPIFSEANALPGVRDLLLSAALRAERYSGSGSTVNPKLGFQWSPAPDLAVRGTWGTSFKAPTLAQQDVSGNIILVRQYVGQTLPGGRVNVIQLSGTSPGLTPEKAETWTFGVGYAPRWVEGFEVNLNYFNVEYRDRILRATSQELLSALGSAGPNPLVVSRSPSPEAVAAYYADPTFNAFGSAVPASQIFAVIDYRQKNLGVVQQSGFDVSAAYRRPTKFGDFGAQVNFVYLDRYAVARIATDAPVDRRNSSNNPVDLTGLAQITWSRGGWDAALTANYVGDYENTSLSPSQHVASWTTIDAHLSYAVTDASGPLKGMRLALDVQNLFGRDPPSVANVAGPLGYDSELANALGRIVSISIDKRW
jgi:outer membrane receptor protein involved in Fe transport